MPSDKSCIVLAMAWEIERLKVTRYFSLSTACCVLSEDLPLLLSRCRFLSCVDMASCTLVRHLDNPAAWLHIIVCSLAALSQLLKMSWLRGREGGAAGKLHLAQPAERTIQLCQFRKPGTHSGQIWVFPVSMHVVPSRRPGRLDKLVPGSPAVSVFLEG